MIHPLITCYTGSYQQAQTTYMLSNLPIIVSQLVAVLSTEVLPGGHLGIVTAAQGQE